jgi:sulfoxide reductase heme-binding subunit YedZ
MGARRRLPLRAIAIALCAIPALKLAADAFLGNLGANPVEAGMNRLGYWTLFFLAVALSPTPLHDLLGWKWIQRLRRTLGLVAFTYATLHLTWYAVVDQFFDWRAIAEDVAKRRFQAAGFAAWLTLVPLALTSTDAAVRRLGYRRWKRLHRLVYATALLGVLHFVWRVKADLRVPTIFATAIALLLLARVVAWAGRRRRRAPAKPTVAA